MIKLRKIAMYNHLNDIWMAVPPSAASHSSVSAMGFSHEKDHLFVEI